MGKRKKKNKKEKPSTPREKVLKPIPDTYLCPCGSSRVYSECCKDLDVWRIDEKGRICKRIKIDPMMAEILKKQKKNLEEKLGRPVRGDDKLFPDIKPKEMISMMTDSLFKAKMHPVVIYCFLLMDGLIVTKENMKILEGRDRDLYNGFQNEYSDLDVEEITDILYHVVKESTDLEYSKEFISNYVIEKEGV